ncbi:methionyl-tRNA formyltransferase [Candidatus Photodesmus blepharus]|uniref:Methionyl-tRNA formyltransferase n=1 Tax=Candidatus Photodesmus blepharonis TaxID=1179155 RepID=A0A084CN87_9GAMM|nr:methionyl-tRNA formyltransferase [Candidatus Photodesmus blepharus]KEY91266.1 methionyl-tRNA formyltransferase [Candidatus Photodesmus blepharus]
MNQSLRIIFAGTPNFAVYHLMTLLSSEHKVVAIYTRPDRLAGRGKKLTSSPIKNMALKHDIPIYQPENFNSDCSKQQLMDLNADLMVVVAYGLLLPKAIINIPKFGCINVHGSILPLWRGAAPIQRSILAGDNKTGITIIRMSVKLDAGDILKVASLPIKSNDTTASMCEKLAKLGSKILISCLKNIANNTVITQKQNHEFASYAKKLKKEEARINWKHSAKYIERSIRAFNPWPISYFRTGNNNIKVWKSSVSEVNSKESAGTIIQMDKTGIYVATGDGILILESLQVPGKKIALVQDILNTQANWLKIGTKLD